MTSARANSIAAAAAIAVVLAVACRDPAREQAERDGRDRARLERIVTADEALDRALKSADDASRAGDEARAATILESGATEASNEAIAEAEREPLETAWAGARRDAILAVMRERRGSIAPYAQALRGEDLDAKLAAIEAQIGLQKRALEAAAAALATPDLPDPG